MQYIQLVSIVSCFQRLPNFSHLVLNGLSVDTFAGADIKSICKFVFIHNRASVVALIIERSQSNESLHNLFVNTRHLVVIHAARYVELQK